MDEAMTGTMTAPAGLEDLDWAGLGLGSSGIRAYETLQDEKRRSVYRLLLDDPARSSVVLKRSPSDQAAREITFFSEVLPRLDGLPALRLIGAGEAGTGETWLLMEDAGTDMFDWQRAEHRRLAGSWLGRFQRLGVHTDLSGIALRDRGPEHFWEHVIVSRRAVEASLAAPDLADDDGVVLGSLLARLRVVEAAWPDLVTECAHLPQTLVHGDFKPDNLRIRMTDRGPDLVVFDWNEGGFGLPALDLSRFLRSDLPDRPNAPADEELAAWIHRMAPDLDAYLSTVREEWPDLDAAAVRRIGQIGELFRCVASTRWKAVRLEYGYVSGPMAHLRYFDEWLGHLIRGLGW